MIRDGKAEGWLQLPPEALLPWAQMNNVDFNLTVPSTIEARGGALLAKEDLKTERKLLTVPRDLILSLERVHQHAKVDKDFREVLEALGEFGRTARGAILTFLLFQASISCPHLDRKVGVHSPFIDYIKSLPLPPLPTFWTPSELALLPGTTLAPALASKIKSLNKEYTHLTTALAPTTWHQTTAPHLTFDDWLLVDAMYRSRALDFPGIGHCVVPCVDLANHVPHEGTVAVYEKDATTGGAVLLLREGQEVRKGEEVSITYGDEKGACEMVFSYGFLDGEMGSAETLFLSLGVGEGGVAGGVKARWADVAPGFKVIDAGDGEVDWKGEFVWVVVVGAGDGLSFELARTVEGGEEVGAFWRGREVEGGAVGLLRVLRESELWDVYRLRAVAVLQERVFEQMQVLFGTQEEVEGAERGAESGVREEVFEVVMRLRRLEFELLEKALEGFEKEKNELAQSPVVVRYLAEMNTDAPETQRNDQGGTENDEDDFS